jgi:hypothetical protein
MGVPFAKRQAHALRRKQSIKRKFAGQPLGICRGISGADTGLRDVPYSLAELVAGFARIEMKHVVTA